VAEGTECLLGARCPGLVIQNGDDGRQPGIEHQTQIVRRGANCSGRRAQRVGTFGRPSRQGNELHDGSMGAYAVRRHAREHHLTRAIVGWHAAAAIVARPEARAEVVESPWSTGSERRVHRIHS
jgi:hypothetical protein